VLQAWRRCLRLCGRLGHGAAGSRAGAHALRKRGDRPRVQARRASSAVSDADIQLNDPQTLYRRWEDSQWSPFAIELAQDGRQWTQMAGDDRELIFYVLSSLMVAEERITTKFSGLVGAYGSEEEATFLATQQVDEARHMQFYARFQDEVVAAPETIAAHVSRARENVSDAFRHIFDKELVAAHERLTAAPASVAAKVRFVTLYHLILEGTLGLTTFKFTTDYLGGEGLLPGFVEGYSKIHHDETRHIGYGVWYLRETVRSQPDVAGVVRETLRDLLPSVAASLAPPDTGSDRDFAAIGATSEAIRDFALGGLTRRLDIIGVPLSSL
jgi:ribonucleoside-diphosphate reductase beta chain